MHVRIDFDFATDAGRAAARRFLEEAAALVVRHGGTLSGEHGDGRARGELLKIMYSPRMLRAFAAFKRIFDPDGVLNPGVIVAPAALDADLALDSGLRPGFRSRTADRRCSRSRTTRTASPVPPADASASAGAAATPAA